MFYYRLTNPEHKGRIVKNENGKYEIFMLYGWQPFNMRRYFDKNGIYANQCEHIDSKEAEKEKTKYITQTLAYLKLAKSYCPNSKTAKLVEEPELKIIAYLYDSKEALSLLGLKFPPSIMNSVNALKKGENENKKSHQTRIKRNDDALKVGLAHELQKRKGKSNRHTQKSKR